MHAILGRRALLPFRLAVLCVLAAAGCGDRPAPVVELADYVAHQAGSVTTDRILPVDGNGLERLQSGWQVVRGEGGGEPHLEIAGRLASLSFYSLDGRVPALEIEATLLESATGRHRLALRLNDRELPDRKLLGTGRHRYRFELPAAAVRPGENTLQLLLLPRRARASRRGPSTVRLHGIAFEPSNGRPPRRARAGRIVIDEVERRGRPERTVQIPSPGRLDLVTPIPPEARFRAGLSVVSDPGPPAPLEVRFELLDSDGVERLLYRRAEEGPFDDRLAIDLSEWSGSLARLRLTFDGGANGVLQLRRAAIEGRRSPEARPPEPEPSGLAAFDPSARLGSRSDVLIVLLDAARADAFSPYGSPYPTPTAERLAAAGTTFLRATSPSSWTGQSVPALLTGFHPDAIGMESWGSRLPAAVPTLAEIFQGAGYRTVLWSQHPFYRSQIELVRGFEEVRFGRQGDVGHLPTAEELLGADERPFFALVHLLPPHTPYDPPAPFRGAYTSSYRGELEPDAPTLNSFPKRRDPAELSPEDRRYIRGRYQENVAFADSLAGRVLEILDAAGRYEDSTVVLLSDHGEAFLEHGRFLHGLYLYAEFVRVPLIVKWPRTAVDFAPFVDRPVGLVDLAPTLIDGLGLEPGAGFQGRTLLPAVFGDAAAEAPPVYAYTRGIADGRRPPRPQHLLEHDGWKIVVDRVRGTHQLFQTEDPLDADELSGLHPLRALLLRQQALRQAALNRTLREGLGTLETRELDPETVERLKALGYL